jgi:ABC-2 type transport system ATP-binding protein
MRETNGVGAVIEVRNLYKRYGETVAVDDVSFEVQEGEISTAIRPTGGNCLSYSG